MSRPATETTSPTHPTVGCVSFLNARPLIDGLDGLDSLRVLYDVPSALLEDLLAGGVDAALCPVIDFQTASEPLQLLPVGGIGCFGPTLTVRLYSRLPFDRLDRVHTDTDSHTSIVLMRLLLNDLYGVRPRLLDLPADRIDPEAQSNTGQPDAMLLIGDKVVTAAPPEDDYPHQLDLGQAWARLTGLPFVFAVWMCRRDAELGDLPDRLDTQRRTNADRTDRIAAEHAPSAGWPLDLARQYLGRFLRYQLGSTELRAIERFWRRAHELELIPRLRPMELHPSTDRTHTG
jgi:chorismate dehydratase